MPSSDPRYLILVAAVAALLPLVPAGRLRLAFLTAISYGFYAAFDARYPLLLATVTICAYAGGRLIAAAPDDRRRDACLATVVLIALAPLLIFKYSARFGLPVGLSFYTFLSVGYLVDVYVGNVDEERDPIRFAAFMSLFPQLMAGPIERAGHLIPQLARVGRFDFERSVSGVRALLAGLFMKVVVADTLAPFVAQVYAPGAARAGAIDVAIATLYFSFQVYADFAGYSLIAIGSARLLGVELLPNFSEPYLSQSVPEFWQRWHMSLSGWFRDYVFTPLQFQWRRLGSLGLAAALVVTFTLVGIWHGAGAKYVLFGFVHGILVSVATVTARARARWWRRTGISARAVAAFRTVTTFIVVALTFVLFRASDVPEALRLYRSLFSGAAGTAMLPLWPFALLLVVVAADLLARFGWSFTMLPRPARWAAYHVGTSSLIAAVLSRYLHGSSSVNQFIYYKF